jgi:hypothetical protein
VDSISPEELQMRLMAPRGEVQVTVSFGPTSSPGLAHAASYAIEHAWCTEEPRSGVWQATFLIEDDEHALAALQHLLYMVYGWRTTRIEVAGSVEQRQTVRAMLGCAREWLITKGRCGGWFPAPRGAPKCRLCPLYDAGYAAEFWVPRPMIVGQAPEWQVPDYVPEDWGEA